MSAFIGFVRLVTFAIIGSVAGVLGFQLLLILPAMVVLFGVFWSLQHLLGRLDGSAQIVWNAIVIFSMFGLLTFGTIVGLLEGWRVGARVASGSSVARALAGSRVFSALSRRIPPLRCKHDDVEKR
jgi:hypothetical protein